MEKPSMISARTEKIGPAHPQMGAAYFGNRFLNHTNKDMAILAECCDYVVHTMSEADLYYHKAALASIFSATRRLGLEVWADPWGLGGVFGGEALSKFLLDHPEDWQVLSNGRRVPAACLNSSRFRNFMKEWVLTVAEMGAQVIFWDEPHVYFHWDLEWEGIYSCNCSACDALFRRKYGRALPSRLDDEARDFRRALLHDFLEELMGFSRKKGLRNALCLYAFEGYKEYERIWNDLASLPSLDIFGCDPYWRWPPRQQRNPAAHVSHFAERVMDAVRPAGKGGQVWIQAMRLPKGAEWEIEKACLAASEAGVTHIAAWSYDGGALLDTVLAENPGEVWGAVQRAFLDLRAKRGK
ncbi:MAG: hypothetical protein HY548_00160 [Elusimicrobia bacterium]|nr:hypothetical protein [Elusimicrobiota bacterium]